VSVYFFACLSWPHDDLAPGPRRRALGSIIRLIDDGSECNFLDKAVVGGQRFGD